MNTVEEIHVLNLINGDTIVGCNLFKVPDTDYVRIDFPCIIIKDES